MNESAKFPLRIGAWRVDALSGEISRPGASVRLEARTMRLLQYLASRAGKVVSIDELLDQVWAGVIVTPDSVYQAVTSLRRQLGDDPKRPTYIATVPRLGYRMIAAVTPWTEQDEAAPADSAPAFDGISSSSPAVAMPKRTARIAWIGLVVLLVALAALFLIHPLSTQSASDTPATRPALSLGVLPFLDLTEGMKDGEFTDGMTEELIDKLSKIPGLRVPAPTVSFHLRDTQLSVAEIGKQLGVVYVLDGSVRKSDTTLRVAARLMRADDGYVLWSETYDRPTDDLLMIQDDIATAVQQSLSKALR